MKHSQHIAAYIFKYVNYFCNNFCVFLLFSTIDFVLFFFRRDYEVAVHIFWGGVCVLSGKMPAKIKLY